MTASWQSRLVHASTGTASGNLSCPRSYMPSTRSDGASLRQNIPCRVQIPVVEAAAPGASPASDIERQNLGDMSAFRAAFAARKEVVHDLQLLAVPGALVGEHPAEGRQSNIRNTPGELPVERHALHIQILYAEDIVASHQVGGQLGKMVPAAVGNACVQKGNPELLAPPAAASLRAAGERPLEDSQFSPRCGQMPWIGHKLPVGKGGQSVDAEIYPHALASLGKRVHLFVQAEGHEVLPSTVLGYRNRAGLTPELPGPADTQVPSLGQTEVVLLPVPRERGTGELGVLLPVLRLEAGVGRPLREEVTVGRLQVPEGLLEGDAGNLVKPGKLGFLLPSRQGGASLPIADRGFVLVVTVLSKLKRPIVDEADTAKGLPEHTLLADARIATEGLPHFHGKSVSPSKIQKPSIKSTGIPPSPEGLGFLPDTR